MNLEIIENLPAGCNKVSWCIEIFCSPLEYYYTKRPDGTWYRFTLDNHQQWKDMRQMVLENNIKPYRAFEILAL